ncbi:MAG: transglutaminase-like domain-containing protein, partial [Candidatus Dormiibacterota bacterium]
MAPPGIGSYLLAVVLILATTGAILAGGWIGGAQATLLVGVVGVVEAILLGRAGIGRLGAVALGLPLCAAVVVPTTIGLLPASLSPSPWYHVVGEYVLQALVGLLSSGSSQFVVWAFMVGLGAVVWACGYWLGWVAFRERRGILAVLPVMVILAVNALNAPSITLSSGAGSSVGLSETLALFIALLVVGLAELGGLAAGWRWRRVPAMEGLRTRFTTSFVLASMLVVVLSLLLPPLTRTDIVNLFAGLGGRGASGPGIGGSGPAQIGFSLNVVPGQALINNPKTVLRYYTSSGQPSYLQVATDDTFVDGNWLQGFEGQQVGIQVSAGQTFPETAAAVGADRSPVTVQISFTGAATGPSSLGLFPGEPESMAAPGVVTGQAATTISGTTPTTAAAASITSPSPDSAGYYCVGNLCPDGATVTASTGVVSIDAVNLSGTGRPSSLQSVGLVSTATAAQLAAAGTAYPAWVTQLYDPPLVASKASAQSKAEAAIIENLAKQWVQGVPGDPYDQASAIEGQLRSAAFAYTLTPPATPQGEWPVDYFLQVSHEGYCQYFADAMGAMLRSLRIPARLVTGYGPGTTVAGAVTGSGQHVFTVTTSDAHVWVEAYFPGYGWVPFEPTPASTVGVYAPFPRGGATAPVVSSAASARAHPKQPGTPTPGAVSSGRGATGRATPAWWLLGFPAGLVLLAILG